MVKLIQFVFFLVVVLPCCLRRQHSAQQSSSGNSATAAAARITSSSSSWCSGKCTLDGRRWSPPCCSTCSTQNTATSAGRIGLARNRREVRDTDSLYLPAKIDRRREYTSFQFLVRVSRHSRDLAIVSRQLLCSAQRIRMTVLLTQNRYICANFFKFM